MAPAPTAGPWADRYRPKHLGEVIGNTDQVRKLAEWLRDWDDVVFKGKVKEQKAPEAWQKFIPAPENLMARACLVSGPPGIGKTTTCTLIARCSPKYSIMEFNASDARSKAIIDNLNNSLAGGHTLKFNSGNGKSIERSVIIMDECDGMAAGDKGGTVALKKMIQTTKNPIICICNDRSDAGIRDLASICYDIKFKRPDNAVVAKRIKHVMESEGKKVELRTIEAVVEACGHDIRHIINQTQFFGAAALTSRESAKDTQVMMNPFEACEKMLSLRGGKMPALAKRLDMFWLDPELMPMMVQENYLKTFEKRNPRKGEDNLMQAAKAAELIAFGDMMAGNWEVQGSASIISTIYPAFLTADESFTRPSFPIWLQKRAPMLKARRLVDELHSKIRLKTTTSSREFATSSYHDLLYKKLVKPLQYGAPKEAAALLFGFGLTREFFTDQATVLRAPLNLEDFYKKVDGKVKSQLHFELNTLIQEAKPPEPVKRKRDDNANEVAARKRRASGGGAGGDDVNDANMDESAPLSAEEQADARRKQMIAKKKLNKNGPVGVSSGAGSLSSWRPKKPVTEESIREENEKKPLMIMKYLDGHTNAVRRTVHMKDILEPWKLF
mmetsp:Transcript_47350/g.134757  ORF Transcript_47350/g.134757 Transcript_47350/m.134757 type:complete len:612 (-) Transcript_47350:149-1984(-)